jgi:hypothetical protein
MQRTVIGLMEIVASAAGDRSLRVIVNNGVAARLHAGTKIPRDVESVLISSVREGDRFQAVIGSIDSSRDPHGDLVLFNAVLDFEPELLSARALLRRLQAEFGLSYAYARHMNPDLSAISETAIRRTLLGGISSVVHLRERVWLCTEGSVVDGAVRGFYPLNFWNDHARATLQRMGVVLDSLKSESSGLVAIEVGDLPRMALQRGELSRFVRLDGAEDIPR